MPGMTSTRSAEWKKFCEENQGWMTTRFNASEADETATVFKTYGRYTCYKKTIPLGKDSSSGFINVFTLDGVNDFCEIVWNTKRELASQAFEQGLSKELSSLSRIGLVMAHLSSWRVTQLERAADAGRKDHQHDAKESFLVLIFQMLNALKPLELLINNYDESVSHSKNLEKLLGVVQQLVTELNKFSGEIDTRQSDSSLDLQERLLYQNLQKDIKILKDQLSAAGSAAVSASGSSDYTTRTTSFLAPGPTAGYEHDLQVLKDSLSGDGPLTPDQTEQVRAVFSSGHVLNNVLHGILSLADHANRNATTLQGDFHGAAQAAHYDLERYQPDLQNPVLPEHQGELAQDLVSQDVSLRLSDYSLVSLKQALLIIANLEGHFSPFSPDSRLATDVGPTAKWFSQDGRGSLHSSGLKPWRSVARIVKNVASLPVDFFYSLGRGSHQPFFCASGRFAIAMGVGDAISQGQDKSASVKDLLAGLQTAAIPIGVSIGLAIRQAMINLVRSAWFGLVDGLGYLLFQIWMESLSDFSYGYCGRNKRQLWIDGGGNSCPALFEHARDLRRQKQSLPLEASQAGSPTAARSRSGSVAALPVLPLDSAYPLRPYHAKGLLPSMVHGLESFYGLFDRHLFAKHSVTSFIFMGTYLAVFTAVYSPALFSAFAGQGPVASFLTNSVFKATGYAFSKGAFFAGIAAGFTYAKVVAGVFEKLIHGQSSWMNSAVRNFAHDPGKYTALIMLSTAFGFLVANKYIPIPVVSEHLKADAGNVPLLAYFFGGLKLLAIGFESAMQPEQHVRTRVSLRSFEEVSVGVLARSEGRDLSVQELQTACAEIVNIRPTVLGRAENPNLRVRREYTTRLDGATQAADTMDNIRGHEALTPWILRLELLEYLATCQNELPALPVHRKRDIAQKIRGLFDGIEARALLTFIYPTKQRSLIGELVHSALSYGGLGLRCIGSALTWSSHPWRDLGAKLESDATANITALFDGVSLILSMFDRIFRVSSDLLFNQIFGRLEFLLSCGKSQCISSIYFGLSQYCHMYKAKVAEWFYGPVHALQARQTLPDLQALVRHVYEKNTAALLYRYEQLENPAGGAAQGAGAPDRPGTAAGSYLPARSIGYHDAVVVSVNPMAPGASSAPARAVPPLLGYSTMDAASGRVRQLQRSASESWRNLWRVRPIGQPCDWQYKEGVSVPNY